jgi:hypothetical protein
MEAYAEGVSWIDFTIIHNFVLESLGVDVVRNVFEIIHEQMEDMCE